ncbi:MAG: AAA family ATPase [Oscillospiraceae bacterium]|nr:AAA family ATPase [Oscillospiraceae bacterium]
MYTQDQIITAMPAAGYTVVLGAAGSGKTAAALKRAAFFAAKPEHPRVLLVTWNRLLASQLLTQSAKETLPRRLTVEGFPDFALRSLKYYGAIAGTGRILDAHRRAAMIRQALQKCQAAHPEEPLFFMPPQFYDEEIRIMQQTDLCYGTHAADDSGSGYQKRLRKCTEEVRRNYQEMRTFGGWRFDAEDLPALLCRAASGTKTPLRYQHIIADDAQDFSPAMLQALFGALAPEGSMTLFADPAQRITGSRYHWQDAGLPVGAVHELSGSRMFPADIRHFLAAIRSGDETAELAVRLSRSAPAAVLCRSTKDLLRVREQLLKTGHESVILHGDTAAGVREPAVYLSTYRDARGLEFAHVLLPFLSAEKLPHPAALLRARTAAEAVANERSLFYCAASRAAESLHLSASGVPSQMLPEGVRALEVISES